MYAVSELLGLILDRQHQRLGKAVFDRIYDRVREALFTNEVRERHDVFVNTVERVSRKYPQLLQNR